MRPCLILGTLFFLIPIVKGQRPQIELKEESVLRVSTSPLSLISSCDLWTEFSFRKEDGKTLVDSEEKSSGECKTSPRSDLSDVQLKRTYEVKREVDICGFISFTGMEITHKKKHYLEIVDSRFIYEKPFPSNPGEVVDQEAEKRYAECLKQRPFYSWDRPMDKIQLKEKDSPPFHPSIHERYGEGRLVQNLPLKNFSKEVDAELGKELVKHLKEVSLIGKSFTLLALEGERSSSVFSGSVNCFDWRGSEGGEKLLYPVKCNVRSQRYGFAFKDLRTINDQDISSLLTGKGAEALYSLIEGILKKQGIPETLSPLKIKSVSLDRLYCLLGTKETTLIRCAFLPPPPMPKDPPIKK